MNPESLLSEEVCKHRSAVRTKGKGKAYAKEQDLYPFVNTTIENTFPLFPLVITFADLASEVKVCQKLYPR